MLDQGKTIRDGMGQASGRSSAEALDLVITNVVIVDWTGIYKVRRIPMAISVPSQDPRRISVLNVVSS